MSKKRFELTINSNGQADIIDWAESKEKNTICIYNDLGVLPFSSAKAICDLLNKQEEEIQLLKLINNGLNYALRNIKKIDVEIDLNEYGDNNE